LRRRKLVSTNRIVHKPLRRSGDGINLVGDVDVAITATPARAKPQARGSLAAGASFSAPGRRPSGPEMMATRIRRSAEWEVRDRECEE
jgi:hypothetical protein